jgi:hypothetical protein
LYSQAEVDKLGNWYLDNLHFPYPTARQKKVLARQTGLTTKQVSSWIYTEIKKANKMNKSFNEQQPNKE